MVFAFTVLAVVLIVEGIPYFAFPHRVKEWARLLEEIPEKNLRAMGLAAMVFGLVLLYALSFYRH
ncbi:MAG TPA: DUF2065 domain-containing protein [Deltaproteobacteria bacterium]|nr:DUF2065 domain-containing protein [Deltaproteobacteria bacterium]